MKPDFTKYFEMPYPEETAAKVRAAIEGDFVSCPEARTLAEKLGIEYRLMGFLINQLKIKITDCDLGCFK